MYFSELIQGFLLGGSLIVAIGAQNAFVLSQSLKGNHEWLIAGICCVCDVLLILLGVGGLGVLLQALPSLTKWIATFGVVFLFGYGLLSFKSMLGRQRMESAERPPLSRKKAIIVTLALTLLNPHVYLDTVMLIGSIAHTKFPDTAWWFALGAVSASVMWFYGLTAFAKVLMPLFKKPRTWQVLDGLIAITMWVIAWSLLRYVLGFDNVG